MYEILLSNLRGRLAENQAVREFIRILQLHQEHPAEVVQQAIEQALAEHIAHLEGVTFCLNRLLDDTPQMLSLELSGRRQLLEIGNQAVPLNCYDQLLSEVGT